jgi:molybdopterin synthase catalytic subunit
VNRADLRTAPVSIDEVLAKVRHAGAGAVALFLGTVRDHNGGRAVVLLEYEAYGAMALAEMERIARETEQQIPGARCAIVHRTGALQVGDTAVVCAASAPHRAEAFAACRRLIDEVKAQVPIWKREHGPDGPYWVGWEDGRCSDHGGSEAEALKEEFRSADDEDDSVHAAEHQRP